MSETPFYEKVVVITGASSGIGKALALQLAEQKAWLVLAARREEALQEVADVCEQKGGMATVVPTDVGVEEQCRHLINEAVNAYGRIDVLVNNAGITTFAVFENVENLSMMEKIMRVNYFGSVYCTYYALPHLKKAGGLIVGISSLSGKTGVPTRAFYAASKHAMAGFFDSLRIELKDTGVDVTMIYPGFVKSDIRKQALGSDGAVIGKSHISEQGIMSAEECAEIIIDAMAKRKRQVVMTTRGKIAQWIKLIAPGMVDNIARKAIERGR
ncbi:MAG: SDR family oxidoreductase [Chloroflexi bacterium]|nr:SDR family oxidoreductase [Chloroflexota bacterium]